MSKSQRTKGQSGEREVAALIRDLPGWDVRRRVRQHDGDNDLLGVPGWAIEVKRHAKAQRGDIRAWWRQTVEQADGVLPVLIYRQDRDEWRAVWPMAIQMVQQRADYWTGYEWTAESSLAGWCALARELASADKAHEAGIALREPPGPGPSGKADRAGNEHRQEDGGRLQPAGEAEGGRANALPTRRRGSAQGVD